MTTKPVRPAAVAGRFYEDNAERLRESLKLAFSGLDKTVTDVQPRALIVPHAGYVFSGHVAASAYACVQPSADYKRIFLLGPSHHTAFDGASVNTAFRAYNTPLGEVPVDLDVAEKLVTNSTLFSYQPQAHSSEHCLEVQLPFLLYHLKHVPPIVPIIIGTEDKALLDRIAEALKPWFTDENLFIISSDFSHYPSYKDACHADGHTATVLEGKPQAEAFVRALEDNRREDIANLLTSACGAAPIYILLRLMEAEGSLKLLHTMYRNSGDSKYGSRNEVVGYHGFICVPDENTLLTEADKQQLLRIAREAIKGKNARGQELSANLRRRLGAFVTLTIDGKLRGCIGHFGEDLPVYEVVQDMARAAAYEDPRFSPLTSKELETVRIEISVLTPLHRIQDISEFQYGKQGIYMRQGWHSGTFLPQVAQEVDWTKEEFLGHCARDKAGIGWSGWRSAELYTYEAIVFKEE